LEIKGTISLDNFRAKPKEMIDSFSKGIPGKGLIFYQGSMTMNGGFNLAKW